MQDKPIKALVLGAANSGKSRFYNQVERLDSNQFVEYKLDRALNTSGGFKSNKTEFNKIYFVYDSS